MPTAAAYSTAFLDWLACAAAGRAERAAQAAQAVGDGVLDRVAAAATAGHVLDFDDTYLPGLAHLSAPTAPAALVVGADRGATMGEVLTAYAAGYEAMGALAAAGHPGLYERGWHPTTVCGGVGAAVATARLLGLDRDREQAAVALALLRAGGLRAGFGSDGKSIAVGRAAADGVAAAQLAAEGATAPLAAAVAAFEATVGGRYAEPRPPAPAIDANWIKAYPCCLQTHAAIEAAERSGTADGTITVTVPPISLRAAAVEDPVDGLQAKFSIPYLTAFTLLHGPPSTHSFDGVDEETRALARARVRVETDESLLESEAVLRTEAGDEVRIEAALGSPLRPMSDEQLLAKVHTLAGDTLDGILDDLDRPAEAVLDAVRLA